MKLRHTCLYSRQGENNEKEIIEIIEKMDYHEMGSGIAHHNRISETRYRAGYPRGRMMQRSTTKPFRREQPRARTISHRQESQYRNKPKISQ
jgi:hypothetical protein